jgi:hypothetical protein
MQVEDTFFCCDPSWFTLLFSGLTWKKSSGNGKRKNDGGIIEHIGFIPTGIFSALLLMFCQM